MKSGYEAELRFPQSYSITRELVGKYGTWHYRLGVVVWVSHRKGLLGAGQVLSWSMQPDTGKPLATHPNQCQGRTGHENQGGDCRAARRQNRGRVQCYVALEDTEHCFTLGSRTRFVPGGQEKNKSAFAGVLCRMSV